TPTFPDVVGGPVQLKGDRLFYATQRVVYGQSFNEHWAVPSSKFVTGTGNHLAYEWWAPWYDLQSFDGDWLILANPSDASSRRRRRSGSRGSGKRRLACRRAARPPRVSRGCWAGRCGWW